MPSSNRGFAIIDVLAMGVIGLIAAIVAQPVVEDAKAESMAASNRAQHQQLASLQAMFIATHDGQFTGPNVTGWLSTPGPGHDPANFTGNTSASTPTQTTDWITPLMGDSLGWSPNRAERTQQLLDQVRDPRNGLVNDGLYAGAAASDIDDFVALIPEGGFHTTSYLAPAAFQFWGTPEPGGFIPGQGSVRGDEDIWLQKYGGVPYNWGNPLQSNIHTPRGYRPRIDMVGSSLAEKAMFADGTRYVEFDGIITYDISPTPGLLGNFASAFFEWEGEVSYGRNRPGLLASARRQGLSKELDSRVLYITYFDGSTRPSTVAQAKARPDWWAPTGSEWVSFDGAAPEAAALYEVGDLLP